MTGMLGIVFRIHPQIPEAAVKGSQHRHIDHKDIDLSFFGQDPPLLPDIDITPAQPIDYKKITKPCVC